MASAARTEAACLKAAQAEHLGQRFTAWRIGEYGKATPLDCAASSLGEAVDGAATRCAHKGRFVILATNTLTGAQVAHFYEIQREAKRQLRRDPLTGEPFWQQRLYHVHLFSMEVTAFSPVEPFEWTPGCDVVGIDRTVIGQ